MFINVTCTIVYVSWKKTLLYCNIIVIVPRLTNERGLYSTILYCTLMYCTLLYCTVQYCYEQYSIVHYSIVQYSNVQYITVLYNTVLSVSFYESNWNLSVWTSFDWILTFRLIEGYVLPGNQPALVAYIYLRQILGNLPNHFWAGFPILYLKLFYTEFCDYFTFKRINIQNKCGSKISWCPGKLKYKIEHKYP